MPNLQQAISLLLVSTLIVSTGWLEGCSKKSSESGKSGQEGQAPATTYATPTADQLSQLVAPIALFPDNLLAQVLAASTFPDQITAAYQWLQQHSSLKGAQLMQTVDQQPWDASVKGLTQFPDVLQQMATNLSWTSSLGDAYFNIPQSVMNAVQVMRQRAYDAGNLKSNPQQNITVAKNEPAPQSQPPAAAPASSGQPQVTVVQSPPQTIVIQPAQPDVVYVPTYNPTAVYGVPVPPPPGYSTGEMVATSLLSFGVGIAVGAAISGGGGCCGWGYNSWGCGWHNSTVVYNHNTYISNSNTFANRNNYYNRNVNNANFNNANFNNVNRNNVNANNINRNDINRNNTNRNNTNRNNVNTNNLNRGQLNNANNRTNNFNNNGRNTPQFNQQRNQPQFRNENAANLGQQRGPGQPNFNQQDRAGLQAQNRPAQQANQPISAANRQTERGNGQQANRNAGNSGAGNFNQSQRQPERGYGDQAANRGSSNGAFSNYGQGGNTRTNSARGQQSLEGRSGGSSGDRSSARAGGGGGERGGARGGGGGGRRR